VDLRERGGKEVVYPVREEHMGEIFQQTVPVRDQEGREHV